MSDRVSERLAAADAAILATFRSGLHIPYAEQRCRALADRDLLEQISGEVAYRLTAKGQRYLAATSEQQRPP